MHRKRKRIISLNLDEDLIDDIDLKRDLAPRSAYVNKALGDIFRRKRRGRR